MNPSPPNRCDVRHSRKGAADVGLYHASTTTRHGQTTRGAGALKSACADAVAMVGWLAAAFSTAAAPKRTTCDLKLTDSAERDIERRLMSSHDHKFR
jgi:hypothetical protein